MSVSINDINISKIFLGDNKVSKVMYNDNAIFSGGSEFILGNYYNINNNSAGQIFETFDENFNKLSSIDLFTIFGEFGLNRAGLSILDFDNDNNLYLKEIKGSGFQDKVHKFNKKGIYLGSFVPFPVECSSYASNSQISDFKYIPSEDVIKMKSSTNEYVIVSTNFEFIRSSSNWEYEHFSFINNEFHVTVTDNGWGAVYVRKYNKSNSQVGSISFGFARDYSWYKASDTTLFLLGRTVGNSDSVVDEHYYIDIETMKIIKSKTLPNQGFYKFKWTNGLLLGYTATTVKLYDEEFTPIWQKTFSGKNSNILSIGTDSEDNFYFTQYYLDNNSANIHNVLAYKINKKGEELKKILLANNVTNLSTYSTRFGGENFFLNYE